MNVTISTDQDYWGQRAPTQAEVDSFVAEIKTVAQEWTTDITVNVVNGNCRNNIESQELVDKAWERWCANG